jgi:hypothetical protein
MLMTCTKILPKIIIGQMTVCLYCAQFEKRNQTIIYTRLALHHIFASYEIVGVAAWKLLRLIYDMLLEFPNRDLLRKHDVEFLKGAVLGLGETEPRPDGGKETEGPLLETGPRL